MSSQAFGWAWGLALPPTEKMVLLALADVASPDLSRFPCSTSYIERVAGMNETQIEDAIASLAAKGLVAHSHGLYRLSLPPQPIRGPRPAIAGCVYVMVSGPKTKVGISSDVKQRLANIRATLPDIRLAHSFPMPITEARKWEAMCLKHFANDALHGEWLSTPSEVVIKHLQTIIGHAGASEHG